MTGTADISELVGKVHVGDCRELAAEMVAAGVTVDAIITSPPYPQNENTKRDRSPCGFDRDGQPRKPRARERAAAKHTHNKPNLKGEVGLEVKIHAPDFLDWFVEIAAALKPCLKPNGNFVVNVDSCCFPTRHRHWGVFSLPERMEAAGWCFVDALIWEKPNGPPVSAATRFHHSWEFVYWFANGDRWEAEIDAVRTAHADTSVQRRVGSPPQFKRDWRRGDGSVENPDATLNEGGARPKDVFSCPVGGTRWESIGGAHFAAMPLKLAEWIVKWASKPGDLVFEPFGGAGTTPVACLRQGRRWIMSEITEAAALIAERRTQLATQGFMDEEIQPEREQVALPFEEATK